MHSHQHQSHGIYTYTQILNLVYRACASQCKMFTSSKGIPNLFIPDSINQILSLIEKSKVSGEQPITVLKQIKKIASRTLKRKNTEPELYNLYDGHLSRLKLASETAASYFISLDLDYSTQPITSYVSQVRKCLRGKYNATEFILSVTENGYSHVLEWLLHKHKIKKKFREKLLEHCTLNSHANSMKVFLTKKEISSDYCKALFELAYKNNQGSIVTLLKQLDNSPITATELSEAVTFSAETGLFSNVKLCFKEFNHYLEYKIWIDAAILASANGHLHLAQFLLENESILLNHKIIEIIISAAIKNDHATIAFSLLSKAKTYYCIQPSYFFDPIFFNQLVESLLRFAIDNQKVNVINLFSDNDLINYVRNAANKDNRHWIIKILQERHRNLLVFNMFAKKRLCEDIAATLTQTYIKLIEQNQENTSLVRRNS